MDVWTHIGKWDLREMICCLSLMVLMFEDALETMGRKKVISQALREDALRRVQAGEKRNVIAREIGITRQGLDAIIDSFLNPEKQKLKAESMLKKRLLEREIEEFKEILEKTEPKDHGFTSRTISWNMDYGSQLAQKLFGKKPAVAVLKPLVKPYEGKNNSRWVGDPKPEPPKPFDIKDLDPDMAKDKEFVRYCKSPIAKQIAWRSYECALREWEERNAKKVSSESNDMMKAVVHQPVGKRVGKHAGSRGSNFQKKKKRRR